MSSKCWTSTDPVRARQQHYFHTSATTLPTVPEIFENQSKMTKVGEAEEYTQINPLLNFLSHLAL